MSQLANLPCGPFGPVSPFCPGYPAKPGGPDKPCTIWKYFKLSIQFSFNFNCVLFENIIIQNDAPIKLCVIKPLKLC